MAAGLDLFLRKVPVGGSSRDRFKQAEKCFRWRLPLGECPRKHATELVDRLRQSGAGDQRNRLCHEIERKAREECVRAWLRIDLDSAEWKHNRKWLQGRFEKRCPNYCEHVAGMSEDEMMALFLWRMLGFRKEDTMTIMRVNEERLDDLMLAAAAALMPDAAVDLLMKAVK
jgi:hypothetical protein